MVAKSEEEILLISVLKLRKATGEADNGLLDSPRHSAYKPGVDADAERSGSFRITHGKWRWSHTSEE
jgi:hypothetical protein